MESVSLRRAGDSLVLTIPRAHAKSLGLTEGGRMDTSVAAGKLVAAPSVRARPSYTLEELLAQGNPDAPLSAEVLEWLNASSVGHEIIE